VDVVVEPAGDVHAAAVHARVTVLQPHDGEGYVAAAQVPGEAVALRQPADHLAARGPEHLAIAAAVGDGPAAPAHRQPAVVPHVVGAAQRHGRAQLGRRLGLSGVSS